MSTELDVYKEWLGIPEGERPPDHYQLLRLLQFEDAPEKIRGNYKKLNTHVRKYATGQYSVRSQELLNELAKAMLCLTDVERKREYDLSLGREMESELAGGRKLLETTLVEQKQISVAQLKEAKDYANRLGLELRDALVTLKMVDPATAAQALASERGLPFVDLSDMLPDDDVLDQVPRGTVKQHSILPLFIDEGVLLVASVDVIQPDVEEELRLRFSMPVRTVLTTPMAINQGISKYYAAGLRQEPQAVGKKSGSVSKVKGDAKPAKAAAPRSAPRRGSPEERQQNRNYGILILCWSLILSSVINYYVIGPNELTDIGGMLASLVLTGGGIAFAWFGFLSKS